MKKFFHVQLTLFVFLCGLAALGQTNPNLKLGNPSNAKTDTADKDNYLLIKEQYALSYNSSRGAPNWVSWTLMRSDIGTVKRQDNFHVETALPESFQRVTPGPTFHTMPEASEPPMWCPY